MVELRGLDYQSIPFATPGLYRWVGNPIYLGWLMLIWAAPTMTVSHLVFAVATTIYISIGIRFEEKDLEAELPEYVAYKANAPALVPGRV